jgi:hypothetical protein
MIFLTNKLDQTLVLESFLLQQKGTVTLLAKLTTEMRLQAPKNQLPRSLHRVQIVLAEKANMIAGLDLAIQN